MSQLRQLAYRVVYNPVINRVLRNINRWLSPLLPANIELPPSGIITVRLKSGSFRFATNQTNTTSQYLFWRGPYYIEYTVIFEELIKRCNCFYDVGAHAGYYSLITGAVNPRCKAVAFEPAAGPFHYLEENIRLNKLQDRVIAVKAALGDEAGTTTFLEVVHEKYRYLEHNLVAVGNLSNEQPNRVMKKTEVAVTRLDDFVAAHPGLEPDIIKMDTEGTEHMILKGARQMLQRKPIVISETLFNSNERELEEIMKQYGYEFYNYKDGALTKVKTIMRTVNDGVHNCFFVHPDKASWVAPYIRG